MPPLDDSELLQLVQLGSSVGMIALYDRYAGLVYAVALRVLKNPASAEDVSQELFLRLWEHPQQIQSTSPTLHGWMAVASRNRSLDLLRKRASEQLEALSLPLPSRLSDKTEQRLVCGKLLNFLSEGERILLEMAFLERMTHAEIALATGLPLGTIKTNIRRALSTLRKSYSAEAQGHSTNVFPIAS
jgi:RNA polymerase sigma-70 factor, ECF subfamily